MNSNDGIDAMLQKKFEMQEFCLHGPNFPYIIEFWSACWFVFRAPGGISDPDKRFWGIYIATFHYVTRMSSVT